jgi:hypothetical protein
MSDQVVDVLKMDVALLGIRALLSMQLKQDELLNSTKLKQVVQSMNELTSLKLGETHKYVSLLGVSSNTSEKKTRHQYVDANYHTSEATKHPLYVDAH